MTTVVETRTTGTGRITAALLGMFSAIATWNDQRVTRNALMKLSDHELEDIGLLRGDIRLL